MALERVAPGKVRWVERPIACLNEATYYVRGKPICGSCKGRRDMTRAMKRSTETAEEKKARLERRRQRRMARKCIPCVGQKPLF